MGDRELLGYLGAGLAALLAFAWRVIKLLVRVRRLDIESRLALARAMEGLQGEVRDFLAHQRQAVYRPGRPRDPGA